jgi:hypothetical protein
MGVKLGLSLRDEHGLRVFDNRVLRRVFGSKRKEVVGGWRRLHNEMLHNLYTSPNIIRLITSRKIRGASHIAHMVEMRNAYKISVGKRKGRNHSEDQDADGRLLEWNLRETDWEDVNWNHLAQGRDQCLL